jgi:hypothetical protein
LHHTKKKKQFQGERRKKNGAQNHHMNKETIGKKQSRLTARKHNTTRTRCETTQRDQRETILLYSIYSTKNGALKVVDEMKL